MSTGRQVNGSRYGLEGLVDPTKGDLAILCWEPNMSAGRDVTVGLGLGGNVAGPSSCGKEETGVCLQEGFFVGLPTRDAVERLSV